MQYGGGSGLTLMATLISYPVLTRIFSQADYGLMALLSSTVFGFVALSKMGLQHAAIRFFPECASEDERRGLRSSLTLTPIITGLASAVILCIAAAAIAIRPDGRSLATLIVLASPLVLLEAVKTLFLNFMRAAHQSARYTIITSVDKYGQLAACIGTVVFLRRDLVGFYLGWLAWNILLVSALMIQGLGTRAIAFTAFSTKPLKPAFAFGAPLLFFEFGNMLLTYSDRYMVAHYMGQEATGIYAAAYNLTVSIQALLLVPLTSIIFPWASKLWTANGPDETTKFASDTLDYFLLITVPMIFGVAVLAAPIMTVFASAKYASGAALLPPLIVAQILFGVYNILALGLFIQKRTTTLAGQIVFAAIFNMAINIWLIPHKGLMGAAWATLLGYTLLVVMAIKVSVPLLPVRLNLRLLGSVVFSGCIMSIAILLLPTNSNLAKLVVGILGGATIYACCVLTFQRHIRDFAWSLFSQSRPAMEGSL
jgi:O-antigen/teichoic acid export membrane protein